MSIIELEALLSRDDLDESTTLHIWQKLGLRKIVPVGISAKDLDNTKDMVKLMHKLNKTNKELICQVIKKDELLKEKDVLIDRLNKKIEYNLNVIIELEQKLKIKGKD